MFDIGKKYTFNTTDGRYYKGTVLQVTETHVVFNGKLGKEGLRILDIKEFREVSE